MEAFFAGGAVEALLVAAVFALAGLVKGVTGMGLPTVSVSLLALWMTPAAAAALLVMPSLVTNLAQCRGPALRRLASRLWPMWAALAVSLVVAPDLSAVSPIDTRIALGAVLVVYGLVGLRRPELPPVPPGERWIGALVGAATGVVTARTAVFVVPVVPCLQALRLARDGTVRALGLSFMVATLALAVRIGRDETHAVLTGMSVVALAAALAGLALGTAARARIGAATFQRALFAMFVLLGAVNLWRGA